MGWTGKITTEVLMEEAGEYCGDNSGITLNVMRKRGAKCASTHELVTRNALLRVMSMAGWQHDKGEEDVESEDWNVAAKGKRGFEHPMASVAVSLFNSTILDKSGGEWTEPGGRGWNDNFMGQHPKERLLGIQLDSQAISTLLLPLKASDPILYRRVLCHTLLSGQLLNDVSCAKKRKNVKNNENWDRSVVSPSHANSSDMAPSDDLSSCRGETSLPRDFSCESKSYESKSDVEEMREDGPPDQGAQTTITPKSPSMGTELLPPLEQEMNAAILTAQAAIDGRPQCILLAVKILLCCFIDTKGGYLSNYCEELYQLPLGAIVGLLVDRGPLRRTNLFARFVQSAVCKVIGTSPASNDELENSVSLPPLTVCDSDGGFELDKGDFGVYSSCDEAGRDFTSNSAVDNVVPFPGVGRGVTTSTLHELAQMSSRFRQQTQKHESPISSVGSLSMALENSETLEPSESYSGVGVNPIPTSSGAGTEKLRDNKKSRSSLIFSNAPVAACSEAAAVFRLHEFFAFGNEGDGNVALELEDSFDVDKLSETEGISPNAESISSPVHSFHSGDSDSDPDPSAALRLVSIESIVLTLLADLEARCHNRDDYPTAIDRIHPHSLSITLLYSLLSQLLSMQKNLKLRTETLGQHPLPTDVGGDNIANTKTPRGMYAQTLWRRRLFLATAMVSTLRVLDANLREAIRHCAASSMQSSMAAAAIVVGNVNRSLLEDSVSFCRPNTLDSADVAPAELRSLSDACQAKMGLSRSSALSAWAAASSLIGVTHEARVAFLRRLLLEVMEEDGNNRNTPPLSGGISLEPCAYLDAMCMCMSDPHELEAFSRSISVLIGLKHDAETDTGVAGASESVPPKTILDTSSGGTSRNEMIVESGTIFPEELMATHHTEDPYSLLGGHGTSSSCPVGGKGVLGLMKILLNRTFNCNLATIPMLSSSRAAEMRLLLKLIHVLGDQLVKCGGSGPDGEESNATALSWNPSQKSDTIRISEDGYTATQVQNKVWGSVMANRGFQPHSGIHEWLIHVRNCVKGHVFVGVATAEASINTYVGGDQYSWGLIGTGVLWHGRSKVRSNCGDGLTAGSVVLLTLDTDRGTLTFTSQRGGIGSSSGVREQPQHTSTSNSEWKVVYPDLPTNEILFPAIGLYQFGDEVTISPVDRLPGSVCSSGQYSSTSLLASTCHESSSLSIFDAYTPILDFMLNLMSQSQKLLLEIYEELVENKIDVESASVRIHSCPLLVHGLPSICASLLVAGQRLPIVATLLAVRLLPNVTSLVRVFDKYLVFLGQDGTTHHLLRANPHGTWRIFSSDANSVPTLDYTAEFCTHLDPESGEYQLVGKSEGDASKKRSSRSAAVIEGRVLGLHIAFMEQWKMEETCVVEGHLSLDGSAFWGMYRNLRSGASGNITGNRICNLDDASSLLSFSVRASAVVAMLAGYLACSLILGVEAKPSEAEAPSTTVTANRLKGGGSYSDESLLSSLSSRRVELQIELWQKSELLKGGLMLREVVPHITAALRSYLPPTSLISDNMNCWISSVFPPRLITMVGSSDSDNTTSGAPTSFLFGNKQNNEEVEIDTLSDICVEQFLTGDGSWLALDAWESRSELKSPLVELGGICLFTAQRWVLAAIATHVRLLPMSRKEFHCFKDLVSKQQPPYYILIEVLRVTRQVMESAARHCQIGSTGYLPVANLLMYKAMFLLNIRPNRTALLNLSEENQDTSSKDNSGDGGTTNSSISLCTAAGQFFQSSLGYMEIRTLCQGMIQSSIVAVFRTAGFSALKLLLNGDDSEGEGIQLQSIPPLHVPFLASAALQYLLPALQGRVPSLVPQVCSQHQLGLGPNAKCAALASYASLENRKAHYLDGTVGANQESTESLVLAFERLYEVLAEQLRTAATARNGAALLALLPVWHLNFKSRDHEFLERVNIFTLLVLSIECVRKETGPETEELLSSTWNSIMRSALQVIQVLASCISLNDDCNEYYDERKEICGEVSSGRKFQGTVVVPEPSTFIKSLFDILFSEFSVTIQKMGVENSEAGITGSNNVATSMSGEHSRAAESCTSLFLLSSEEMRGVFCKDQYCYFLLGLVYNLYTSLQSCIKCLTSQEWLNVLFRSIVVGSPAVQHRALRLLFQLLPSINPPIEPDGMMETAMGSTECAEEFLLLCLGGNIVPSCAMGLVRSMKLHSTENMSVATQCQANSHQQLSVDNVFNSNSGGNMHVNSSNAPLMLPSGGISSPVAEEIVALLRRLLKEPAWKDYVLSTIMNAIDGCSEQLFSGGERQNWYYDDKYRGDDAWFCRIVRAAAAVSVLGGFIESLHLGSSVALRRVPHRGIPDTLMTQLTGSRKPFLLLTSLNIQSNTAQVILSKRKDIGSGGSVQQRDWHGKNVGLSNSAHVTGGGGVHVFKVTCDELRAVPLVDAPVYSSTASSIAVAEKLFNAFLNQALPWVMRGRLLDVNEREESESSTLERLSSQYSAGNFEIAAETAHQSGATTGEDDRAAARNCDSDPTLTLLEIHEEEVSRAERCALQSLLAIQYFKASATLLADPELSRVLLRSKPDLTDLFEVAVGDAESGLLQQLEHHEELWLAAWDKWHSRLRRWAATLSEAAVSRNTDGGTMVTSTTAERAPLPSALSTAGAENENDISVDSSINGLSSEELPRRQHASNDSSSSGSQNNLSSLVSYVTGAAMALGVGTIVMDTGTAVAQMAEMGFPEGWSRAALSRCGNSLEQAVAFCFENSANMDQIVADEEAEVATMQATVASSSGDDERGGERVWGGNNRGGGGSGGEQEALGLATPGSSSPPPNLETMLFMKQLLEMGFTRSCCAKALSLNRNNIDLALTWILSNSEALAAGGLDEDGDPKSEKKKMESASDSSVSAVSINPLQVISGGAHISADLCTEGVAGRGFASVGARGCLLTSGKWYFEATLMTAGCMQLGWADAAFQGNAESGDGVGDGPHSWAFDGWRECKWHGEHSRWGAGWKAGDVVGCMINFDEQTMSFNLNGLGEEIGMGVAFNSFTYSGGLYPCASFNRDERLRFNFGKVSFTHSPPPGYQPYIESVRERMSCFSNMIKGHHLFPREGSSKEEWGAEESSLLGHHQAILEDCLEEEAGIKAYACHAHYFAMDPGTKTRMGGEGVGCLPHVFPDAGFLPSSEVEAMTADIKALASASRALCTLYAWQASLMLLVNCSSDVVQGITDGWGEGQGKGNRAELVMKLLLLSTAETSVDTNTVGAAVNNNDKVLLPSDLLAGGARTQKALSCVVKDMLEMDHRSSRPDSPFLCCTLTACVAEQIIKACSRQYAHHSVYPVLAGGMRSINELSSSSSTSSSSSSRKLFKNIRSTVSRKHPNWSGRRRPAAAHNGGLLTPTMSGNVVSRPNLGVVLWISSIVLAQVFNNRCREGSEEEENDTLISTTATDMCRSWSLSFNSPNVTLKLLGSVVVSGILQGLSSLALALPKGRRRLRVLSALSACLSYIPASRLYSALLARLWTERMSTPIFSRFLKGLVEVNTSIHIARILCKDKGDNDFDLDAPCSEMSLRYPPSIPKRLDPPSLPLQELNRYCCEWDEGFVLSSEGWLLWSGRVTQRTIHWDSLDRPQTCSSTSSISATGDDIISPPLVPGCFVVKKEDWKDEYIGECPHHMRSDSVTESKIDGDSKSVNSEDENDEEQGYGHSEGGGMANEDEERSQTEVDGDDGSASQLQPRENSPLPSHGLSSSVHKGNDNKNDCHPSCLLIGSVVEIVPLGGLPGGGRRVEWKDGSQGIYKWGADGCIDLIHIKLDSDGYIERSFPPPELPEDRAVLSGFGANPSWGVLLRMRPGPRFHNQDQNHSCRTSTGIPFTGVLEWPDFSAAVAVEGEITADGSSLLFVEKQMVYGDPHIGWESRFATPGYISGTSYVITATGGKNLPPSSLNGTCTGIAKLPGSCVDVTCDVTLSDEDLFSFDPTNCCNSISVSSNGRLATCIKPDRGMVYGNVGFSWGIHYWEVKVVEGEPGCIFLGVAEKLPPSSQHMKEWHGLGFVNYRATYYNGIERVYGEHFNSGDTVGIRLDMDRGVLGFYLDGMKYGEHVTIDLGAAFEELLGGTSRVFPQTLFPVVGFSNCGDRVALSTKWLSTPGCHPEMLLDNAMATAGLLQCWEEAQADITTTSSILTTTTTTSPPLPNYAEQLPRWFCVKAWQLWLRWRSGRWRRVGTRVHNGPQVDLDMSPRACAKASLLLGLGTLLFSGDVVRVMNSCGRHLEQPETCMVLGALGNKLFYRLESQKSSNASTSYGSSTAAWCWTPHDLPSMGAVTVLRRGDDVPDSVCALPLPRLRIHCGGWLRVVFKGGATIRNGVTEQSLELGVIPYGAVLLTSSCHECSFGIRQFFVCYEGIHGWVCEMMCGRVEETIMHRITDEEAVNSGHDLDVGATTTVGAEESVFEDVDEAVEEWAHMVKELGCTAVKWLHMYNHPDDSLEFFESASCKDGIWTLDMDFNIVRLLNEVASCCATDPINVPFVRLEGAFVAVTDSFSSGSQSLQDPLERTIHSVISGGEGGSSSSLAHLAPGLVLARMAVLLTLNLHVIQALPFYSLTLPEKEWENNNRHTVEPGGWAPMCVARKLRDLRRLLFTATKQAFWDSLIDASTTTTPLHHDEYEDPREIRVIKVNRVKAAPSRLCTVSNPSERLKQSIFGQLHREMRGWPASAFRRAHVGKGHGGQRRAFKVKFLGEGVDDYGGPYRAVFEQVADELQKDDLTLKPGQPVENTCLLPLLVPTPNRAASVGQGQEKFLLAPSPVGDAIFSGGVIEEFACFLGKLLGAAVRHGLQMRLNLTPLVWNPLVDLPVGPELLQSVDHITHRILRDVESMGAALESGKINALPKEWDHVTMSAPLSNNQEVPLVPFGDHIPLSRDNWREYVQKLGHLRLTESRSTLQAFQDGLATVLPVGIFPLFTAEELERLICGVQNIDVNLLRDCTEYDEGVSPGDKHVLAFWEVLEEMQPSERTAFLRFVWARSRMPSSAKDFPMLFKIQAPQGGARDSPDDFLPSAQTCFFSLSLPFYTSKQVLRKKLLYAIAASPNMDADVRLNSTEGAWS